MTGVVLLLAAGSGERLGAGPKGFVQLRGVSLLRRAADAAAAARLVEAVIAAVPAGHEERARDLLAGLDVAFDVVAGGATRQASAAAALAAAGEPRAVVIHDAARALCPPALFDACLAALDEVEVALAAVGVHDTVKRVSGDQVAGTLDRSVLVRAQTPQAFRTGTYRRALAAARDAGVEATDDVALAERLGIPVRAVPGDERNMKITTALDLAVAEALLDRCE